MGKYLWAVGGGAIVLWMFTWFFPIIQRVSVTTNNSISGNYSGIHEAITFSPLILWIGIFSLPMVVIGVYLWQRRQGNL